MGVFVLSQETLVERDSASTGGDSAVSRYVVVALVVVLPLLSAGLAINLQSPWVDEIFTLGAASKGSPWMSAYIGMSSHTMPLYPFLIWFFSAGGTSLVGARLLSVLSFMGAAYFFYRGSARLFDGKTAAWAAGLFSIHPLLVWHALDARMYMLGLMIAMAAFWLLIETLESGSRRHTVLLGVVVFLGLLNHLYFALFAAPLVLLVALYRVETHRLRGFITLCAGGALAVPVMATMILMQDAYPGYDKALNPVAAMGYSALTLSGGYAIGATKEELHGADAMKAMRPHLPIVGAAILAFWLPVVIGAGVMVRRDWKKAAMLVAFPVFAVIVPYALAVVTGSVSFNVRYTLAAVPMVLLPVGYLLARTKTPVRWAAVALIVGVEAFGLFSWYTNEKHWNEDYRSLTAYLVEQCGAEDLLYSNPVGPVQIALENEGYEREVVYLVLDAFDDSVGLSPRRFYVFNRPWRADPSNRMRSRLEQTPGMEKREFRGFVVYVVPAKAPA